MIRRRCSFKKYAWNVVSGKSPLIINNSERDRFRSFSVIGKSEQVQTTGKNLFDISKLSSNMAVEITEDKLVLPQGGAIYFNSLKETSPELKIGDEVFLFGDTTSSLKQVGFHHPTISIPMWTFGNKITITKEILESSLLFYSDVSKRTVIQNIMITKENSKTYEPYTGGKPSPSPDYPQEIKSVGKWNELTQKYEVDVKVTGKNLFNKNAAKQGYEFGVAISDVEVTNQKWFVSDFMPVKATTYQISGKKTGSGCKLYNKDKAFVKNIQCPFGGIKFDEGIEYFRINGEIKDLDKIQVEEGGTPTLYEPYKEQTIKLSLDQPLLRIGDYVDKVTKDGIVRNNKLTILDGNESWILNNDPNMTIVNRFQIGIPTINTYYKKLTITDRFRWLLISLDSLNYVGQYNHGHAFFIQVPKDLYPSLEVFKEWLSKNPTKLCYVLEHPIIEPLPEDFKQALDNLKTYYPTTVITVDGGEVDPDIEVQYAARELI